MIARPYRSFAPTGLKRSTVVLYTLGVERQVVGGLTANVQFVRRNFDRVFGPSEWARRGRRLRPAPRPMGDIGTSGDLTERSPSTGGHPRLFVSWRYNCLAVHRPEAARESLGDAGVVHAVADARQRET